MELISIPITCFSWSSRPVSPFISDSLKTGKIGEKVVDAYQKVEDAFVNTFLEKDTEKED